jgi:hypothetical protein
MWPRTNDSRLERPIATDRPPDGDLVEWRQRQLVRAGFEAGQARALARECSVDLHALIELVERGCPPALAARILAPLDHEVSPC